MVRLWVLWEGKEEEEEVLGLLLGGRVDESSFLFLLLLRRPPPLLASAQESWLPHSSSMGLLEDRSLEDRSLVTRHHLRSPPSSPDVVSCPCHLLSTRPISASWRSCGPGSAR